jgi:hypothetical protein
MMSGTACIWEKEELVLLLDMLIKLLEVTHALLFFNL